MNMLSKISAALCTLMLSFPCFAYVGPGAGLGAIGALIALIAALGYTFWGLLWYPLKHLICKLGKRRAKNTLEENEQEQVNAASRSGSEHEK
jgi:hypothetical protein